MNEEQQIQMRLWNYIDGNLDAEEKSVIEDLLQNDKTWQDRYRELADLHQLINHNLELEEPSMRFAKNVMEEISKAKVAPATKMYINKKIISVIAAFFIISISVLLFYCFTGINWNMAGNSTVSIDLKKFDVSRYPITSH